MQCFVQNGRHEIITVMVFQQSTCFPFPGTYQCFIGCQSRSSSDALNTASVELLRQEQSTAEQFRLKPLTEHQCVLFYEHNELLAKNRLNISVHFNSQPTPLV